MTPENADRCANGPTIAIDRCPSLCDWSPSAVLDELSPGEIRVWLVALDDGLTAGQIDTAEPASELAFLDDLEKARSARFVRAIHRRRFARGRAALRQILGNLLHESPAALLFRAIGQGKPELDFERMGLDQRDPRRDLRFNVSHSSDLALIGVCRGAEIGVDLEWIKPKIEADRIVASFFSPAEQAEFALIADDLKSLAFFRGWTRKEAVLKEIGVGLGGLSARYETGFGTCELGPCFIPATPPPGAPDWQLWEAAPRSGFVATVAVRVAATGALLPSPPPGNRVASPSEDAVH
jgi:4'-phosphopantetheinyl transferase